MEETNYITIGRILGVHGIKGFVKIKSYLEEPYDIFNFNEIFINKTKFKRIYFRFRKKTNFIVELDGVNRLDEAKNFVNLDILIKKELLPKLKEKEFYLNDLISFNVKSEKGRVLGKITGFFDFGAGLIAEVKRDNKLDLLPFSNEFIVKIDNKSKLIIISSNVEQFLGV